MRLAVILSTYNAIDRLEPTLIGYAAQTRRDFELIVADDGSKEDTRRLIEAVAARHRMTIKHVWQEDIGFRKCRILNQAMLATSANYLIFSDGDCVPRRDFVEQHARRAKAGRFLSGGYLKLDDVATRAINEEVILDGRALSADWLTAASRRASGKLKRLKYPNWQTGLLNRITPTRPSWNGHNSSGWRTDLLSVNGFDERMAYWAQDREFGERLHWAGIRGLQIRYSALCVHLDHARPYKTDASRERNKEIRRETQRSRATWTEHGVLKGPRDVASAAHPERPEHDVLVDVLA